MSLGQAHSLDYSVGFQTLVKELKAFFAFTIIKLLEMLCIDQSNLELHNANLVLG